MSATPQPLTAEPLWRRARAMFARALAAIGDISALAALTAFAPGVRRQIVAWLAPLEHIVRKLLLAEAASWRQRMMAEAVRLHARHIPSRGKRDPAQRQTSRATFALSPPRDPLLVPDARAPRIRALWDEIAQIDTHANTTRAPVCHAQDAPVRLARRLEALQCVLENPLPHARRLARLLTRAMRRFPEIVHRYLFAPARTGDYDKDDPRLAIDAIGAALHAPDMITDSS